jgi:DNA-binding transcriptional LysR family regulator
MEEKFRGIEIFAKIIDVGSIRHAAEELGVSKSVVSFELKRLEDRLNARLVNRTTRRISLTEAGNRFLSHCRTMLKTMREAELEAADFTASPKGCLKVAAAPGFGAIHIAPLLPDFNRLFPQIDLQLDLDVNFVDLVADSYDLAVRVTILPDSGLRRHRIAPNHMIICAAPALLQTAPPVSVPADLEKWKCLRYSDDWPYWSQWLGSLPINARPRRLECAFTCNSVQALRSAALGGLGAAMLPYYVVGPDLRNGQLVRVLAGWPYVHGEISAVFPHAEHLAAKVRVFIDFLAARLGGERFAA